MSLIKNTEKYVIDILNKLGYEKDSCEILPSSVSKLGQFQINVAMSLAKEYHKNPKEIAEEIVSNFDSRFVNVNIAGAGFINLSFSDQVILEYMNSILADFNNNVDKEKSKKIIIDYGGANAAKALHVGHMRSPNIGESLRRIALLYGNEVISDVHLGDLGRQSGMLISEIMLNDPELEFFDENFTGEYPKINLTTNDLALLYSKANEEANNDIKRMELVRKIAEEVEKGRRGYLALWQQIVDISIVDIKKNYNRLNCNFDLWEGEMDSLNYIEETLEILQPYLYESAGAMVMDVNEITDKKEIPPLMVLKCNGSTKYETRDLATIRKRMKNYHPDEIWYVVDERQALNFVQVFRGSYKSGLVPKETKLCHYGFGTINGTDGKPFKTRDGGVMQLSYLLDLISKEIEKKVSDKVLWDERADIVEKLTIATIKFADLLPYRKTDYIFDPIKFSSFQGKTGPYIMYTLVRCKSILRNNELIDYKMDIINNQIKDIYVKIINLSSVLYKAYKNASPNVICEFLFELCNLYNKFYNEVNITLEKDIRIKNNYLALTKLVNNVISKCLELLAINTVEKM